MQLDWWTIGLQTINFGILVWLLRRFLYKPVLAMIGARRAEVRQQFDAAKEIEGKAKAQLAAVETERAGIAAEREAALKAAAAQAREMAEARQAQAEREAQALIGATRKTLAQEREKALDEARRLALDLGVDFAQRLLAEIPAHYRAEAWIERIENHLKSLSPAERDPLARQLADGTPLTVVTACALPPATADQWNERLRRSLGLSGGITFEVDPQLIAGAELRFPTAILRFSWQNALLAARTEVGADGRPR
jgi:F-type H+-transporting ATPase subunit b